MLPSRRSAKEFPELTFELLASKVRNLVRAKAVLLVFLRKDNVRPKLQVVSANQLADVIAQRVRGVSVVPRDGEPLSSSRLP